MSMHFHPERVSNTGGAADTGGTGVAERLVSSSSSLSSLTEAMPTERPSIFSKGIGFLGTMGIGGTKIEPPFRGMTSTGIMGGGTRGSEGNMTEILGKRRHGGSRPVGGSDASWEGTGEEESGDDEASGGGGCGGCGGGCGVGGSGGGNGRRRIRGGSVSSGGGGG